MPEAIASLLRRLWLRMGLNSAALLGAGVGLLMGLAELSKGVSMPSGDYGRGAGEVMIGGAVFLAFGWSMLWLTGALLLLGLRIQLLRELALEDSPDATALEEPLQAGERTLKWVRQLWLAAAFPQILVLTPVLVFLLWSAFLYVYDHV